MITLITAWLRSVSETGRPLGKFPKAFKGTGCFSPGSCASQVGRPLEGGVVSPGEAEGPWGGDKPFRAGSVVNENLCPEL